jgi:hypothetical protein
MWPNTDFPRIQYFKPAIRLRIQSFESRDPELAEVYFGFQGIQSKFHIKGLFAPLVCTCNFAVILVAI